MGRWITPKYSGEANMRPTKHHNQAVRYKNKDSARSKWGRPLSEKVQLSNFLTKKKAKYCQGSSSRLCGDITHLKMNIKSTETGHKNVNACMVCGKMAYSKCSICGIYLYLMENRGQSEHYGPAYLTSTMILFLVWHVQIQYFKKMKTGIIPHLLIWEKIILL